MSGGKNNRAGLRARFMTNVKADPSGCILWTGHKGKTGYGIIRGNGKILRAHRAALILNGIEIPEGMYVDHLCRIRHCVNPDHLRIVTPKVNALENTASIVALNATKTHCLNGHEFTAENTGRQGKKRYCIACLKKRSRRWYVDNRQPKRLSNG